MNGRHVDGRRKQRLTKHGAIQEVVALMDAISQGKAWFEVAPRIHEINEFAVRHFPIRNSECDRSASPAAWRTRSSTVGL
jgi:hypothetical protein